LDSRLGADFLKPHGFEHSPLKATVVSFSIIAFTISISFVILAKAAI
jgi:hypothetical protein